MNESELQKTCVKWFRLQYPDLLIYSTPNEGKRSYALANHYRSMGMTSGVPDLVIPKPSDPYHGLYVELKIKPNKLNDNQKKIIKILLSENYAVAVCYTFEEFVDSVNKYLSGRIK